MNAIERDIYFYVKAQRRQLVPMREIARRVGGRRRFHAHPDWATVVLADMVERGILETDDSKGFRIKPLPKERTAGKKWATPAIAKLLKEQGKDFGAVINPDDEDEFYLNL